MKEIALQVTAATKGQKLNTLREYLQNYILFLMQKVGMNRELYFVGGTALRFLYHIRRFSEDLDFSASAGWCAADLPVFIAKMEDHLLNAGYSCTFTVKSEKTVQKATIGFEGLLYESGLSHRREHKLSIFLEIDNNPPAGWSGEKTIVDKHLPVMLHHYDLPSLYAGKVHALLMRPYTKGRDIYDLFWYRTKQKGLLPNFVLLNNAIAQTAENAGVIDKDNWLRVLNEKMARLVWKEVEKDVLPFLEFQDERLTFTKENLLMLL